VGSFGGRDLIAAGVRQFHRRARQWRERPAAISANGVDGEANGFAHEMFGSRHSAVTTNRNERGGQSNLAGVILKNRPICPGNGMKSMSAHQLGSGNTTNTTVRKWVEQMARARPAGKDFLVAMGPRPKRNF